VLSGSLFTSSTIFAYARVDASRPVHGTVCGVDLAHREEVDALRAEQAKTAFAAIPIAVEHHRLPFRDV